MIGERILYIANAFIPSLQLSFVQPMQPLVEAGTVVTDLLTEQELNTRFKASKAGSEAAAWVRERLEAFRPTLIILCRYSSVHPQLVVEWAREAGVPTIFHIDDDLLNVPIEIGAAKHAAHNHPDRLATVRYLLDEATLVYCSTPALRERLFGHERAPRVVSGAVYCAHDVLCAPTAASPPVIGYMGFDHAHDFELALPALIRTLDTFPEVRFELFGSVPVPGSLARFNDRVQTIAPVRDYAGFMQRLASLAWTIGICPLADTPFNRLKADTKWVEYTACGFAVIASRGTIYDDCVTAGGGLLCATDDEWVAAFSALLTNEALRHEAIIRSQDHLRRNYSPVVLAAQIEAVIKQARSLIEAPAAEQLAITAKAALPIDGARTGLRTGSEAARHSVELRCGDLLSRSSHRDFQASRVKDEGSGRSAIDSAAAALSTVWRMFGGAPGLRPTLTSGSQIVSILAEQDDGPGDASSVSLRSLDARGGWHLADAWWADSRLLKLRTAVATADAKDSNPTRLRVFQPEHQGDGSFRLRLVDVTSIACHKASVRGVRLQSPLFPVVLVGDRGEDEIAFADFIPFPSLLRGGLHDSEAPVLGRSGGTLADVRDLGDSYVAELLGWSFGGNPLSIAQIGIDITSATGAEPVFDPEVILWLTKCIGVALCCDGLGERTATDLDDGSFATYAALQLRRYQPDPGRGGPLRLKLPAHSLPTIASVTSRRLHSSALPQFGSFIVLDDTLPRRRYLVTYPDHGAIALPLSKATFRDAPRLERLGGAADGGEPTADPPPLAIQFRDLEPRAALQLLYPVPKDIPVLDPHSQPGVSISILAWITDVEAELRGVLSSILGQVTDHDTEVVLAVLDNGASRAQRARAELDRAFNGRGRIAQLGPTVTVNAALNRAASLATGECFVVLDPSVLLHDYRCVSTLAGIAARNGIGTAGCMLVKPRRPDDSTPVFHSAGWLSASSGSDLKPFAAQSTADCWNALLNATYPVAANSRSLFSISARAWASVGGLDSDRFPDAGSEVDLAARLVGNGFVNMCTTTVSAYLRNTDEERRNREGEALADVGADLLGRALRSSVVIRDF